MGYSTNFEGTIKPNRELKASEIAFMEELFKFDPRAGDYSKNSPYEFYHIDLSFTDDYSGFSWNDSEKSYGMEQQVEFVINKTLEKYPDLIFNGEFRAQGEEYDDRWYLIVKDNKVTRKDIELAGFKVECPHCGDEFRVNEKGEVV